ncbi:MAG: divalent-cation tolerance protein CutA [Pseudomonadota bacterium]
MASSTDFALVYTTAPDLAVAEAIGSQLVEEGLAACVNVLPGMRSIYSWQGQVQRDEEVVALVKTRANLAARVIARIEDLHPYDVPAAFVIPTSGGSSEFLKWVGEQTDAGD